MRTLIMLACALIAVPSVASAREPDVAQYQASVGREREELRAYISGTAHAYNWANAATKAAGGEPLYCQPARLALTQDQVTSILDRWLERRPPQEGPSFLALEMLLALKDTFPCETPGAAS